MTMQYLSLFQLNNDYSLAPDKIEIKREMFSDYQLMIADFYNILMGNVERLVPASLWECTTLLEAKIKTRTIHHALVFNQWQWLKQYVEFNTQKRIEAEWKRGKDGKALCKLMNNAVYGKAMENVRNRINVKLVSNIRGYLKWTSEPRYMLQKILDNNLA